jgi:hypothetical protein
MKKEEASGIAKNSPRRMNGEPFTMSVRTELPAAEIQAMPSRLSVYFVREE